MLVERNGVGGDTLSRGGQIGAREAFTTGIACATVVRVATILVFVQPTRLGYSDGDRLRVLMPCCSGSGVKCECRVLL